MPKDFSKVIEIRCDECGRSETFWYDLKASRRSIIENVRHMEGWSIGRKRCVCPKCRQDK